MKKYIKVTDAFWDILISNNVLSQFEIEEFKVTYQLVYALHIYNIYLLTVFLIYTWLGINKRYIIYLMSFHSQLMHK